MQLLPCITLPTTMTLWSQPHCMIWYSWVCVLKHKNVQPMVLTSPLSSVTLWSMLNLNPLKSSKRKLQLRASSATNNTCQWKKTIVSCYLFSNLLTQHQSIFTLNQFQKMWSIISCTMALIHLSEIHHFPTSHIKTAHHVCKTINKVEKSMRQRPNKAKLRSSYANTKKGIRYR